MNAPDKEALLSRMRVLATGLEEIKKQAELLPEGEPHDYILHILGYIIPLPSKCMDAIEKGVSGDDH